MPKSNLMKLGKVVEIKKGSVNAIVKLEIVKNKINYFLKKINGPYHLK